MVLYLDTKERPSPATGLHRCRPQAFLAAVLSVTRTPPDSRIPWGTLASRRCRRPKFNVFIDWPTTALSCTCGVAICWPLLPHADLTVAVEAPCQSGRVPRPALVTGHACYGAFGHSRCGRFP